ncbi:COG1470 family protein [Paenibacillus caseinilyticus]|uniref:Alginate lyase domain-containing protein n=1 Tax=Paenibacillus mucilaginosus K02 TaxID=997761 RepID=I0BFI5_9BACL|nr:hypothetical protein [Paenibacillus mucilaginosus]AFH61132.1 hypothetical protein B2K_10410 [Paenibacillus mucilaginosus K02]
MKRIEDLRAWSGMNLRVGEAADDAIPSAAVSPGVEAVFQYDHAEDWRSWEALALEVWVPAGTVVELTVKVYPLCIGRPEYIPVTTAVLAVTGQGWTPVEAAFERFDAKRAAPAFWRLIAKVGLTVRYASGEQAEPMPIRRIRLQAKGGLRMHAERLSRSALPGETVRYNLTVRNESKEPQAVVLGVEQYGYESMETRLEPAMLLLQPGESGVVAFTAVMHEGIAPGGCEEHQLYAVPNGDSSRAKRLKLYTARALPHPYILHTEAGWEEVRRHVQTYAWARKELEACVRTAEAWIVPETRGAGEPYAFELAERFNLHAASVAWKLTGRPEFRDKAALLLKRLADEESGYPATDSPYLHIYAAAEELELRTPRGPKVCGGGLIHEGEFMLDAASCYDLLHDSGAFSAEEHRRIESAFRIYIEKADWMITDGDTNNIPSGGMAGALLCALAIQDMRWVRRFIDGPGGFKDMVAAGVMDDGWYFEGASNYVVLFADMFTRLVHACEPWGLGLKDLRVRPAYRKNAMLSPWTERMDRPFLGMSFDKLGPVTRNYRTVKDVWDAMLPFTDVRGILFGVNDSTAKDMVRWYDLAYHVWRDPSYVSVIRGADRRDLLYGVGELPEPPADHSERSACADNTGLAILRSRRDAAGNSAPIAAVIKYGSHGGYHGHFDRTALTALMRHGKNAYGPLASWYGYGSFLFKMWVQASLSHNMVAVDQRMQEPAEAKRLLFHSGEMLQVCAVETTARWMDPPYGGQTPYPESFPEERGWIEGRDMPVPPVPRAQGDTGTSSEPVLQRRLVAVTDDYVVVADYLRGEEEHTFDSLHHYQGFEGLEARELRHLRHTGQMNGDPYGAGQFITDCDWYACGGPAKVRFSHHYDRQRDDSAGRHILHNEEGRMHLHLHSLWPPRQEVMTGWYAEADPVNKRVTYEVTGDGEVLAEGRFGAWILGTRQVSVPLEGTRELRLRVTVDRSVKKTVFWGDPVVILADGRRLPVTELPVRYENVDRGSGAGTDYYGGPVHLAGMPYPAALPFEPLDPQLPAAAVFNLTGVKAASFESVLGGDYPAGLDPARRKTVSIRSKGREAAFIAILEPHEGTSAIRSAEAFSADLIRVTLTDGRVQEISIHGMNGDGKDLGIRIRESRDGGMVREEESGPTD